MTTTPSCADLTPPEADRMFFTRTHQEQARRICTRCPVAAECLEAALEVEGDDPSAYRFGVYGATTPVERAKAAGATVYVDRRTR